jgi:membrane protein YdbS with pleckstrin-like domain
LGVGGFILLISLLFVMGRVWDIVLALVGVSLVVPMGLLTIDHGLRYGGIEYRVSDDAIVAYDRLFRTRVWRIEPWDESGLRVERGRLHRWFDTSTVVIEYSDRELWLPHLADTEPILEVFDREPNGV